MNPDIETKVNELENKVSELQTQVQTTQTNSGYALKFPMDNQGEKVLVDVVAERLAETFWDRTFYHSSVFESIDRYLVVNSATITSDGLVLSTSGGTSVASLLTNEGLITSDRITYFSVFTGVADVSAATLDIEILSGSSGGAVGLKIDGGDIQGYTYDGSNTNEVSIGTATDGSFYLLELVYYPGTRVDFYVNGILKGSSALNMPPLTTLPNKIIAISLEAITGTTTSETTFYKILQKT